jgi:hypothetical protein
MPRETKSWSNGDEDWLRQNSSKYTINQMAQALGRSRASVEHKLRRDSLSFVKGMAKPITPPVDDTEAMMFEDIPTDAILQFMKDTPRSIDQLSERFNRSPNTMRRAVEWLLEYGYAITRTTTGQHTWSTKVPRIVAPPTILWDKDVWEFKLGAVGDWHDGSKAAQISARNKAIEIMYKEGVRDIIVPGDINAGRNVYKGQDVDNVSMQPDHQTAITEAYCPRYEGLRYHIMGGNHDFSFVIHGGHDALKTLCDRRDDFLWYGYDLVTVRLTEDVDALVWHPSGGSAYAMSYRSQKMVEQLAFEQLMEVIRKNATPKVRFLFVGHWHNIFMWYAKGPINIIHTGGMEGQNNLTRRMGNIVPCISAIIVSGEITRDRNLIRRLRIEPMNFTEIEDDYLNYPIPQPEPIQPEPLFKWEGRLPSV